MITNEWKIIDTFLKQPWEGLTLKQVKELSRNKSDNYVYKTLKKYSKKGILKEKKYGKTIVYSLVRNEKTIRLLSLVAEHKADMTAQLPQREINKLLNEIPSAFFSFIITGSYAENKQNRNSDIDIVVICDNGSDTKKILINLKSEGDLMIPSVHPYVFTEDQFYEMLVNKEANYGKEIVKKHIIISGAESFYRILFRAIENGFNGWDIFG